jgi:hypothetical protein
MAKGLNDNSGVKGFDISAKVVALYGIGYLQKLVEDRRDRTDVVQAMGIGVGQDGSFLCMDSTYMNSGD